MTTWHHGIVHDENGYHVEEVYYDDNDKPVSWTCGLHPHGETIEELRRELNSMLVAVYQFEAEQPVRTECQRCAGPYDEHTDAWGLCGPCEAAT